MTHIVLKSHILKVLHNKVVVYGMVAPCVGYGHHGGGQEVLDEEADQGVRGPTVPLPVLGWSGVKLVFEVVFHLPQSKKKPLLL